MSQYNTVYLKPWLDSVRGKIDEMENHEIVRKVREVVLDHESFGLRAVKRLFDKEILGREMIDQPAD